MSGIIKDGHELYTKTEKLKKKVKKLTYLATKVYKAHLKLQQEEQDRAQQSGEEERSPRVKYVFQLVHS